MRVEGRDGPANHDRLCVKGRFGFDYAHHPHRLTKPLIRKPGAPKHGDFTVDPTRWSEVFREATWEEALDLAAGGLREGPRRARRHGARGIRQRQGLERGGLPLPEAGAHRLRLQQRRPLHAPVPRLVGGGAARGHRLGRGVQPGLRRREGRVHLPHRLQPDLQPPGGGHLDQERGASGARSSCVADPRRTDIARHAWRVLQFKPDMDVALLNAMIHTILEENLVDPEFIRTRTTGFEALKENAKGFSPEAMAPLCGIPAETIREVARAYATSKGSMILWGMGISQHVHGTDNARCLIALTLMTGPDRAARHGPASAARPEQRAGRVRRGPHPDDVPGLPARGQPGSQRALREVLGARSSTRSRASPWSRSWTPRARGRSAACT